jgi:hypothetical protein
MPRPPARFTETDLKRAVKVARQAGEDMAVRVLPDGSIEIYRKFAGESPDLAPKQAWVT